MLFRLCTINKISHKTLAFLSGCILSRIMACSKFTAEKVVRMTSRLVFGVIFVSGVVFVCNSFVTHAKPIFFENNECEVTGLNTYM